MSDLIASFYSLAKTNNGLFKSENQAKFLLSKCENNVFHRKCVAIFGVSQFSRHDYDVTIVCDSIGIVSIKHTSKTENLFFNRLSDAEYSLKHEKQQTELIVISRLKKLTSVQKFIDSVESSRLRKLRRSSLTESQKNQIFSSMESRRLAVESEIISLRTLLSGY